MGPVGCVWSDSAAAYLGVDVALVLCHNRGMNLTACDTEQCTTCHANVIEGVDQNGQCARCAGTDSFAHMLRLMAAGVTRDKATGRFASTKKG